LRDAPKRRIGVVHLTTSRESQPWMPHDELARYASAARFVQRFRAHLTTCTHTGSSG